MPLKKCSFGSKKSKKKTNEFGLFDFIRKSSEEQKKIAKDAEGYGVDKWSKWSSKAGRLKRAEKIGEKAKTYEKAKEKEEIAKLSQEIENLKNSMQNYRTDEVNFLNSIKDIVPNATNDYRIKDIIENFNNLNDEASKKRVLKKLGCGSNDQVKDMLKLALLGNVFGPSKPSVEYPSYPMITNQPQYPMLANQPYPMEVNFGKKSRKSKKKTHKFGYQVKPAYQVVRDLFNDIATSGCDSSQVNSYTFNFGSNVVKRKRRNRRKSKKSKRSKRKNRRSKRKNRKSKRSKRPKRSTKKSRKSRKKSKRSKKRRSKRKSKVSKRSKK